MYVRLIGNPRTVSQLGRRPCSGLFGLFRSHSTALRILLLTFGRFSFLVGFARNRSVIFVFFLNCVVTIDIKGKVVTWWQFFFFTFPYYNKEI